MSDQEYSESESEPEEYYDSSGSEILEDFEERSPSPIPEDVTPQCIYCYQSLFYLPHSCGATENCKNRYNLLTNCHCNWHKQLKDL